MLPSGPRSTRGPGWTGADSPQARSAAADQDAVIRVAAATAAANTVEEVLELAAEQARGAIEAASLTISRFDPDERRARVLINVGDLGPGEERYPADQTYSFDDFPIVEQLIAERTPYFNSLADPECPPGPARILRETHKSAGVGVPIEVDGVVWGAVWATRAIGRPAFGEADAVFLGLIANQVAIVVARALELDRVSALAYQDDLTGLANRRAFRRRLDDLQARAGRSDRRFCVLLCDVDGLKGVNDVEGHEAGDRALHAVGRALDRACSTVDYGAFPARLAGDEFGILLAEATLDDAGALGRAVIEDLAGRSELVSVSCGVAESSGDRDSGDVLAAADAAVYAAKQEGGARVSSIAITAPPPDRLRRTFRGRPGDRIRAAVSELVERLDGELRDADVLARLEAVARTLSEAGDFASWAISVARESSTRLVDLSVGENSTRRYVSLQPGPDTSEYEIDDFPATAAIIAAGSGCILSRRDDPDCEPAERELLELYGVTSVVGAVGATGGDVYMLELYGDEFTPAPGELCTPLRLLCRAAMPPRP